MNELREWTSALSSNLGLDTDEVNSAGAADRELLVALTRGATRTVTEQAGTVTAYLVGMAVARGLPLPEAAARLEELTLNWPRIDWRD